ncbi:MAG: GNAT family N-acetyltransferase [Bacteroidota bacterium]
MKFDPVTVTLKNNVHVLIREAGTNDAERLLDTVKAYVKDSAYLLTTHEEFDITVEKEREWIRSFLDHDNSLLLVAEYKGQIIGNIDLTGGRKNRIKHTSLIGISLLKEWQNIGLGTALFDCAIAWAKHKSPIELLWLQVVGPNSNAIALYAKMGFTESGRQKGYFRLSESRYEDNVTMSLALK